MSVEFVLAPRAPSLEPAISSAFFFDPAEVRSVLTVAAGSGFDAILVDDAGGPLTNVDIAASIAQWNAQLDVILTHWTGVTSPTVAASDFASLDRLAGGRLSLRILAADAQADGFVETWRKTDEYLMLLKRLWRQKRPFDYDGRFYSLRHALVADKGLRGQAIPIRISGNTGTEIDVAARHATVVELTETEPGAIARQIDRIAAASARSGRAGSIAFSVLMDASQKHPAESLEWIAGCLSAGITEFMVTGLAGPHAIERFGFEVIAPTRDTTLQPRREIRSVPGPGMALGL